MNFKFIGLVILIVMLLEVLEKKSLSANDCFVRKVCYNGNVPKKTDGTGKVGGKEMLELEEIQNIMQQFGLFVKEITGFHDTSHSEDDKRLNYILDNTYVLKVNSATAMWEDRLEEIRRLILRYRSISVYCPDLLPASDGSLSYILHKDGREYTCFVEEFAKYPVLGWDAEHDRKEVIEHLGILAATYTGVDLSETKSMWSIIDLAPLDVDIDEKQENTNMLVEALQKHGYEELAKQVDDLNNLAREKIKEVFEEQPRCVYQGDLNSTNELQADGHFAGLIDFNMAGTDVNINVFLNETNWFPEEEEFDRLSVPELLAKQDAEQEEQLSVILRHYTLNESEKKVFPYYKQIVRLFQYPDVCAMVEWLGNDARRKKCIDLITGMMEKPL